MMKPTTPVTTKIEFQNSGRTLRPRLSSSTKRQIHIQATSSPTIRMSATRLKYSPTPVDWFSGFPR